VPLGRLRQVVEVGLAQRRRLRQDALGRLAPGLGVELLAADLEDLYPPIARQVDDVGDDAGVLHVVGHPQFAHLAPPGQQQLPHRLASSTWSPPSPRSRSRSR
jgi:hypothetical protein